MILTKKFFIDWRPQKSWYESTGNCWCNTQDMVALGFMILTKKIFKNFPNFELFIAEIFEYFRKYLIQEISIFSFQQSVF